MPSPNPRIQVCASPDLYARVKTMAKGRGITLSNMVQELCEVALATEEIRAEYEQHCKVSGEVPVQEDKRTKPVARPWSVDYTEEDRKKAMDTFGIAITPDEEGSWVDPNLTEDEKIQMGLGKAKSARPVFSPEDQSKIMEMVRAGVITKEKAVEMMSYQPPAPEQSKDEKQMEMRGDLLKTIGEQDERIKRMEQMMSQLLAATTKS